MTDRQSAQGEGNASGPPPAADAPAGGPLAGVIVGVGASAGGLEALEKLFARTPAEGGIAYVVVQHLDRHHPSLLSDLLRRHTSMPVREVEDGDKAEPGHVWVIPPNALLTLQDGALRVTRPPEPGPRMPIDTFFRSLAEERGELAVGILLSGADHDGTLGLRAIKEHAGLTLAQSPDTAKHPTMPGNAIEAGFVDVVLPVEEMPERLYAHFRALAERMSIETQESEVRAALPRICDVLRRSTGHDFSRYKEGTLVRRVRRRIQVHRMPGVSGYLRLLDEDPAEPRLLLRDLLIGVTQFFRDAGAFDALVEHVLPELTRDAASERPLRVWVPGCATGEEAYSIAMLLHERLGDGRRRAVQIFATDIDEQAIAAARAARYREDVAEQVSPERLERYFQCDGAGYQVVKELREMCVFSTHNLIRDPPFSALDLISCRNLLIYLEPDLQKRVIPLFHYALRRSGFLFLGPSEELSGHTDLFAAVDKKQRVFQRKDTLVRPVLDLPLAGHRGARGLSGAPLPEPSVRSTKQVVNQAFERMVLEEHAPPCAVVDERGEIVCVAGTFGDLLKPRPGVLTTNILDYAAGTLRHAIRTALREAAAKGTVIRSEIAVPIEEVTRHLRLTVRPAPGVPPQSGLYAVILEDVGAGRVAVGGPPVLSAEPVIEQLENELQTTRADLQTAVEELESTNEELKSSNEELMSTNEELQSANEELQTSKEELQSVNEELETMNNDLLQTVQELGVANSDLSNLFAATQIATIFLDRDLHLAKFTPAATALFNFIDSDVGRPLGDLAPRFAGMDLLSAVRQVLQTLAPIEQEAQGERAWFIVRVMPYRTVDGAVAGAVVTFSDVTRLKRAELKVRENERLLEDIIDGSPALIFIKDVQGRYVTVNRRLAELLGKTREEMAGKTDFDIMSAGQAELRRELIRRVVATGEPLEVEETLDFGRGPAIYLASRFPLWDPSGKAYGVCALLLDITERKRMEERLQATHERMTTILESISDGFYSLDRQWRFTYVNRRALKLWGKQLEEVLGQGIWEVFPEGKETESYERMHRVMESREQMQYETYSSRIRQWLSVTLYPAEQGLSVYFQDITARKMADDALREADRRKTEFLAILSHELRNPLAPIKNSLSIIERVPPGAEQARKAVDVIARQVAQLSHLVDDLLDVTRVSQNKIQLQRARLDVGELVRRTVEDHRSLFEKAQVRIEVEVPREPLFANADGTRLAQVIGNLLQNAAKFTGSGGSTAVTVARDEADKSAVVRVKDSGVGMAPETVARLFQPFMQADTTLDRSQGGLGLGLTLVKGLVELHGGSVAAKSAGIGRGSEIVVMLPLDETQAAGEDVGQRGAEPGSFRVLIIEDNIDAADTLREVLELSGHDVAVAYNGPEGLRRAREARPDVVLCDIGLPGMDGYEVARAFRADPALEGTILVALSGYARPEDIQQATEAGFDSHLAKPPSIEKLEELLASLKRRA